MKYSENYYVDKNFNNATTTIEVWNKTFRFISIKTIFKYAKVSLDELFGSGEKLRQFKCLQEVSKNILQSLIATQKRKSFLDSSSFKFLLINFQVWRNLNFLFKTYKICAWKIFPIFLSKLNFNKKRKCLVK